jgi:hypothetical protein
MSAAKAGEHNNMATALAVTTRMKASTLINVEGAFLFH